MRTELRTDLPPLPSRMQKLPLDHRGYPVPWFVAWVNGEPDFRAAAQEKIVVAVKQKSCWLCAEPLGKYLAFVIGPMCAINRTISEPPSHRDCAEFAVRACPFLTRPMAKRRTAGLDTFEHNPAPGVGIKRNPGVAVLWVTRSYQVMRVGDGVLFSLGNPEEVQWFCEGRPATQAEVKHSIETGLPLLQESADAQGPHAQAELKRRTEAVFAAIPHQCAA